MPYYFLKMISGINPEKIPRHIARHVLLFLLAITAFFVESANAQYWVNENKTWAIWRNDGLDFNSGVPVPITTGIWSAEGSATISDPSGALLFCTDGYFIWDRSGNPMDNSDDLLGTGSLSSQTISTSQSAVILPVPDTPGRYYVFSLTQNERGPEAGKLYYSMVDMTLNGGLGGVIPGRKSILLDTGLTEKLTITPGQRCNIWLLTTTKWVSGVKAFEITTAGLNRNPVFSPTPFSYGNYDAGVMKVSPDGKKIAVCNMQEGGLSVFDFDGASGTVSNGMLIDAGSGYYGAAFSPDNTKLYTNHMSTSGSLYQYEVNMGSGNAIRNSRIRVTNAVFSDLKLGPDGKIYMKSPTGGVSIAVIHEPNIKGTGCQYEANVIQLLSGTTDLTRSGFPNEVALLIKDTVGRSVDYAFCFADSVSLSADTSGWDYAWDDGSSGPDRQVYASGTYAVEYFTPPCRLIRDTFRIQLLSPSLSAGMHTLCGGEEDFLWVNPGASDPHNYHYIWRDSAGNTVRERQGTNGDTLYDLAGSAYTVRVTAPGCDTVISFVLPGPAIYRAGFSAPDFACIGDTVAFQNTSTGLDSYTWHFGDGDSSVATDPVHVYTTPGTYSVMLIGYPCRDTAIRLITVDSTPYVGFTMNRDHICTGEEVLFYPQHPEGVTEYSWSFGNGQDTSRERQPAYTFEQEGVYDVTLTLTFRACPNAAFSAPVTVFPTPMVLLAQDTVICPGDPAIELSNLAEEQHAGAYFWSTEERSEVIYAAEPGIYSLAVTSAGGCSASDTIHIGKSCLLDIPNIFSPNGDGVNDYFFPRDVLARGLLSFRMQIFNRWGQLIYESKSLSDRGWDGTHNGQPIPPGVLVYSIRAVFRNGVSEHYYGNVTLIR